MAVGGEDEAEDGAAGGEIRGGEAAAVGFGDLAPVGAVRFLSGTEALTGFVLITWSASFTYLEMERYWRQR